jgi:hypothetical protein
MLGDDEIKARAAGAFAVLVLIGGAAVTIVPQGVSVCGGRPCATDSQASGDPVFWWSPHLDLEHQPPGSGVASGGTAVNGSPLSLRWDLDRA